MIGICGGSGSGKSTLAKNVAEGLDSQQVTLISMDSFYKYQEEPSYEKRCETNYDHPDSIDSEIMLKAIQDLKNGQDVLIPVYDFTIHNRSDEPWTLIKSTPVIIIDGILLFAFPEIVNQLDLKIFVDTDADVRALRRLKRDVEKRGRSIESVFTQYITTVKPMHEKFVEPGKHIADIVVPEGGKNIIACNMIIQSIKNTLKEL